jgi:hypothetical protein
MNSIKKVLLGLLLATGACAASANVVSGYDFVMFDPVEGSTRQQWDFSVGDSSVQKGDAFSYELLFNTPPLAPSTYFVFDVAGLNAGDIAFDDVEFVAMGDPMTLPSGFSLSFGDSRATGSGFLDSGTYDLYLSGTFLADGGVVFGRAADDINVTNVPEPMSLALFGLGAAGMAGLRRRKAARAA